MVLNDCCDAGRDLTVSHQVSGYPKKRRNSAARDTKQDYPAPCGSPRDNNMPRADRVPNMWFWDASRGVPSNLVL
jgi:hypothetical protein